MATPEPSSTSTVRDLVAQYLDSLQEGTGAGLDEFCDRHPDHESAIRARIDQLDRSGLLPGNPGSEVPRRLGPFELGPKIGGGGMGVVYRARDTALHREVALKLVRPEIAVFDSATARFRREVEAVASLQHPGIVPVLSVGEENATPYFAMELVNGCSLAEILRELHGTDPKSLTAASLSETVRKLRRVEQPADEVTGSQVFVGTWVQACLRLVRDVAHALNHAHHRGIVHRDIKPSNIMVTESGRVMLVDFGLAQLEHDDQLTRTGSMLGSLAYMSPEQVQGERVDPRTDVYSLGATLCELLTLEPPYVGASQAVIAARILEEPPPHLRTRNDAVPRDVEILCETAMAKRRDDRFPSIADFARDLDNVLELRPIEARRPPALVRAKRWVQRHRAGSAAIALATILVVGGPITFGLYERSARDAIEHQRERAQTNLRRLRGVVERQLANLREIEAIPGVQPIYRVMVSDALDEFETILEQVEGERESDPTLRVDIAETLRLVASLHRQLGDREAAIAAATRSLEQWQALIEEQPHTWAHHTNRASTLLDRARNRIAIDDLDGWRRDSDEAIQTLEELRTEDIDADTRTRVETVLAGALGQRALDLISAGSGLEDATSAADRALELWADARDAIADDADLQAEIVALRTGLGKFRYLTGDFATAEEHFAAALEFARPLAGTTDSPTDRARLAMLLQHQAAVFGNTGRMAVARETSAAAADVYRRLTDEYPLVAEYQDGLGRCLRNLVLIDDATNEVTQTTLDQAYEAIALLENLLERTPESTLYAIQLSEAYCHAAMAEKHRKVPLAETIEAHYDRALAVIRDSLESRPDDPELLYQISASLTNYADWKRMIHEPKAALELLEAALPYKERMLELNPKNLDYVRSVRNHHFFSAQAYLQEGKADAAMASLHGAVQHAGEDASAFIRFAKAAATASTIPETSDERVRLEDQALAWLRKAIELGWSDLELLRTDRELTPLQGRLEMQALLDGDS